MKYDPYICSVINKTLVVMKTKAELINSIHFDVDRQLIYCVGKNNLIYGIDTSYGLYSHVKDLIENDLHRLRREHLKDICDSIILLGKIMGHVQFVFKSN